MGEPFHAWGSAQARAQHEKNVHPKRFAILGQLRAPRARHGGARTPKTPRTPAGGGQQPSGGGGGPRTRARFYAVFSPGPLLKHDFGPSGAPTRARGAPTTTRELFLLHKPRA